MSVEKKCCDLLPFVGRIGIETGNESGREGRQSGARNHDVKIRIRCKLKSLQYLSCHLTVLTREYKGGVKPERAALTTGAILITSGRVPAIKSTRCITNNRAPIEGLEMERHDGYRQPLLGSGV